MTPVALVQACASDSPDQRMWEEHAKAVAEYEAALDAVKPVQDVLNAVLTRRVYTIRVEVPFEYVSPYRRNYPVKPSVLYTQLSTGEPHQEASAFASLLDRAADWKEIGTVHSLDCIDGTFGDPRSVGGLGPSPLRERTARRLDAVLRIIVEPCPPKGQRINSPGASRPKQDSLVTRSREELRQLQELDRDTELSTGDVWSMIIGQGYLFERTDDEKILLGSFLRQAVSRTFVRVNDAFDRAGSPKGPAKLVFDRTRTAAGSGLKGERRGWFNAVATTTEIYVSPTILRAAVVVCASTIKSRPSLVFRMEESLNFLKDRRLTPMDVRSFVQTGTKVSERAYECIDEQLTFLIAHEVAHQRLPTTSETVADCVGSAVAGNLNRPSPALFGTAILDLVGTADEEILGADDAALRQLTCRTKAPWFTSGGRNGQMDLRAQVEACKAAETLCRAQ